MAPSTASRLVALGGCGALALMLQVPAQAVDPTFTTITTPSARTTVLDRGAPHPQFAVAGTASPDITAVNVLCVRGTGLAAVATTLASAVPVTGGAFSTTAQVPPVLGDSPICRIRAVPQGVSVTGSLSSYGGPLLNLDSLETVSSGATTFDFDLTAGSGDGQMAVQSAGRCGDAEVGTVPLDLASPPVASACVANLGPGPAAGSVGSLHVDGHLALLPHSVFTFSDPTVALTVHVHAAKSGRVTWTESAPLVRCQGTDTYPPPAGQCDDVVPVGVTFTRSGVFAASGHQISLRDTFSSTDGHRHRVRTVYGMEFSEPGTGDLGFAFPNNTGGFHSASPGQVVMGLPASAATFLVRSDRFSSEGDPQADTRAVTWSRPPERLGFAADPAAFGLRYELDVPKNGAVRLGFTDSNAIRTSTARAMGARAVAHVMPTPTITSPGKGAVIPGTRTVVKGTVKAGVNGLPVSVKVNGHPATLTPKGASRATYRAVFTEPLGKHTITATAKDAGGNRRSTSITVRNK